MTDFEALLAAHSNNLQARWLAFFVEGQFRRCASRLRYRCCGPTDRRSARDQLQADQSGRVPRYIGPARPRTCSGWKPPQSRSTRAGWRIRTGQVRRGTERWVPDRLGPYRGHRIGDGWTHSTDSRFSPRTNCGEFLPAV